jgi:hypothetical protein
VDVEVFTAAAGAAERWIASDEVAARWAQSSTLEGYTVAGLAGHLARAVLTVERCLAAPAATTGGGGTDAAGYFAVVLGTDDPVDSERHRRIRDRGAETAADGPRAVAVQVGEARQRLEGRLGAATLAQPIEVAGGVTLAVADYLETRVVELVVHLDDLAVSVGSDEPAGLPAAAVDVAAAVLAQLAARRSTSRTG